MITIDAQGKDLRAVNHALKQSVNGQTILLENASHLNGLAAGLTHGDVLVQDDAGDYMAVLNSGATIRVGKNAGKYLADNMTGGQVIVDGSTDYGAGQYCYGGTLVIHGNAGDFTATMNKGAVIIVEGSVGNEVGTYMLKGDLVIIGNAGENLANYLIRGSVYIAGEWQSLGHNTRVEPMTPEDIQKLRTYFETYGIKAHPEGFKKIVAASMKPFYK